jgi:acyl-coenzyme A thioesterase PaaI-like protein
MDDATPVQGSPFLEASGLLRVEQAADEWQSLLLPVARNDAAVGTIADGAVAALIDNCGSMAAYTADGLDHGMLGATLSMHVVFGDDVGGALVGSGRLIARAGSTLTGAVEIWSPTDGRVRADGLICYRIRGAG